MTIEWIEHPPTRGVNPASKARVTVAWRSVGNKGRNPALQVNVHRAIAEPMGLVKGGRLRVFFNPERTKMLVALDNAAEASATRACQIHHGTACVAVAADWVASEKRKAETVQHAVTVSGIEIELPSWAHPPRAAMQAKAAVKPPMKRAQPPTRLTSAMTNGRPTDEEDEAEALEMMRNGSHGRQLAEYFGWDLERAAEVAKRLRAQIDAERARAA